MTGCACGHFCCCAPRTVACPNCGGSGRIVVLPAFPPRAPGYPVPQRSVPMYRLLPLRF
jgi:hypothetical protein